MKYINSGNEALVSAQRQHLERKQIPGMGDFLPEYKAINQSYKQMGGDATIAYMDVLAQTAQKITVAQQQQYDRMEANQAIQGVDESFAVAEQEFLANNPSGKGYTGFVTDTYTKLYKDAQARASNPNVGNLLAGFCESKKAKLTHNAFQAEQSMYRAYVINDTEPRINSLLNTAVKHPEQYDILQEQMEAYLEPLRDTMPASAYEQLVHEKKQDLVYSTGLGLIDKDPQQALSLLDKPDFKAIPQDKYFRLQKYAHGAIEDEKRQARREAREAAHLNMVMQQQICDMYKLALAQNVPGTEEQIKKEDRISEHMRNSLLLLSSRQKKEDERVLKVRQTLDKALWGEDSVEDGKITSKYAKPKDNIDTIKLEDITPKEVDDYYSNIIKTRNNLNKQQGEEPLSISQKIDIGRQISNVYSGNLKSLKLEIANNIRTSKNTKEIMDACISLYGNENLSAIDGIDSDVQHFSRLAVNLYKGDQNEQKLLEKRDAWFNVDKDTLERNKLVWKDSDYGSSKSKTRTNALVDLYKKAGYKRWWSDSISDSLDAQAIRDKVEPILKDAFLRSGNQAEAEVIAIDYMHSFIKNSDINGKMQPMINPPTEENIEGHTEKEIRKKIEKIKEKIIEYYKTKKKKNLSVNDIKIEAVSVAKPIYNFYFLEDGLKVYCVDRERDDVPETRTVFWPNRKKDK